MARDFPWATSWEIWHPDGRLGRHLQNVEGSAMTSHSRFSAEGTWRRPTTSAETGAMVAQKVPATVPPSYQCQKARMSIRIFRAR